MKLTIDKTELLKQIDSSIGAIGNGNNLAILSHILLSVQGETATMSATDLSIELTCTFPILNGEDGALAFPAKKVHEIVKELPSGEVHLTAVENALVISAGKSRFNITGILPAQDFPTLKNPDTELTVPFGADALSLFLSQVRHAMSDDETKFNLCGVFMHVREGKLAFAATNGHRLSLVEREKELPEDFLPKRGVIVPRKGVMEIIKLTEQCKGGGVVSLAHKNGTLFVKTGNTQLAVRLVDGDYPDYRKVIPISENAKAIINKQYLVQAIKRISIMAEQTKEGKGRATLTFSSDVLNISASNNTTGEASEEFEIKYDGAPAEVNVNSRYALEALAALEKDEEDVVLALHGAGKPITLTGTKAHFQSIIMPMRA